MTSACLSHVCKHADVCSDLTNFIPREQTVKPAHDSCRSLHTLATRASLPWTLSHWPLARNLFKKWAQFLYLLLYIFFLFQTTLDGSLHPSRPHTHFAGRSDGHHSLLFAWPNFSVPPGEGATVYIVGLSLAFLYKLVKVHENYDKHICVCVANEINRLFYGICYLCWWLMSELFSFFLFFNLPVTSECRPEASGGSSFGNSVHPSHHHDFRHPAVERPPPGWQLRQTSCSVCCLHFQHQPGLHQGTSGSN